MTVAIDVRGLSFHFDDGTPALSDVSFSVEEGEAVALIGPNGAGKSTLLLHLNGVLPEGSTRHAQGSLKIDGRPLDADSASWVRRRVGLLFQDPDDQLFCPTVGEDVAFGPEQLGLEVAEVRRRVERALSEVGLSGFQSRMPQRLSSGEKKRVCLAGLLAYDPSILALDEPTAGLDPRGRREFIELLATLKVTRLLATHDLSMVAELCPRTLLIDRGKLVADARTLELFQNEPLMRAHGMECPSRDLPAHLVSRTLEVAS